MRPTPSSSTTQYGVVLDKNPVMQHGEGGTAGDFAIFIKKWAMKNDIITLPLTGLA
jgi:hypothetical protein